MNKIYLLLFLTLFSVKSYAGDCPDGSDPIKSISDDGTYFVYKCGGSSNNNSAADTSSNNTSSVKASEIEIYDVAFSSDVLEDLLNRIVSKLDYDFSNHKLSKNDKDITCIFRIARIIYDVIEEGSIEGWNLAEGNINIMGSDVEFSKRARWNMGGLSSDPSYFRDEVNIKLTDSGHLVGKIAYFTHTVKQGETPRNPIYPTLTEHKRSTPINLSNIKNINAKLFIDVEDWAGGVMYINYCKDL